MNHNANTPAPEHGPGYVPCTASAPADAPAHVLTVNGLRVDASAIGAGLYAMILEADEGHIVAFGMIPKRVVDTFENGLRIKIIDTVATQTQVPAALVAQHVDEAKLRATIQPITHAVCVAIYAAAAKAGTMRV